MEIFQEQAPSKSCYDLHYDDNDDNDHHDDHYDHDHGLTQAFQEVIADLNLLIKTFKQLPHFFRLALV